MNVQQLGWSCCYPADWRYIEREVGTTDGGRVVEAARGRSVVDFGARRGHGPHSGFLNARASYLAGFSGTSHVEAARRLGLNRGTLIERVRKYGLAGGAMNSAV